MEKQHCERCDQPATVHIASVDDGDLTESHLCAEQATEAGLVGGDQAMVAGMTSQSGIPRSLRGTVNFVRSRGRSPATVKELREGIALRAPFPTVEITNPELIKALKWMEGLIRFYETHGRMPRSETEMSPEKPDSSASDAAP
jgi:hypothetical protein